MCRLKYKYRSDGYFMLVSLSPPGSLSGEKCCSLCCFHQINPVPTAYTQCRHHCLPLPHTLLIVQLARDAAYFGGHRLCTSNQNKVGVQTTKMTRSALRKCSRLGVKARIKWVKGAGLVVTLDTWHAGLGVAPSQYRGRGRQNRGGSEMR